MMKRKGSAGLWVLLAAVVVTGAWAMCAQPAAGQALETKITSVAIFKDGYSFFIREGEVQLEDGWCFTQVVPPASKGTIWAFSNEANVDAVINAGENEVRFGDGAELVAKLQRKVGLQLRVMAREEAHEGKLEHVLEDMILLSQNRQMLAVKLGDIEKVYVVGQPLMIHLEGVTGDAKVRVGLGYLAPGISWVPSYTLELADEEKAVLTLRGTVTNDNDTLEECSLALVVGVPNFIYRGQLDELVVRRMIEAGRRAGVTAAPSQVMAEAARAAAPAPAYMEGGGAPMPPAFVGQEMTEMFFYTKEKVSLRAGDVGMLQVFRRPISYESLYEWDADAGQEAWHILRLKNDLEMPLTTGPVLVLRERKALGQDQLKYVPPGAKGNLRLTVAADIQTKASEVEVERGEPLVIRELRYIPVTNKATLTVSSYRDEEVKVKITKSVVGQFLGATEGGELVQSRQPKGEVDPVSTVEWTVSVKPGEQKTVECTYLSHIRI